MYQPKRRRALVLIMQNAVKKRPRRSLVAPEISPARAERLGRALLSWYETHKRRLPWRDRPEPYAVWVSEVMLQQTQVDTVIPYFERWMARFPDLDALAKANEDEVLAHWQGLGYYSRARALMRSARQLTDSGHTTLPSTVDELRRLPGIGPYTAGAIASIAFGRDEPLVDGNVIRVLSRLFALVGDPSRGPTMNLLWSLAATLLVPGRAAEFNQALMELGALVCRPKDPQCTACPWQRDCQARKQGEPQRYPALKARPKPTLIHTSAALCRRGDKVLLVQLQPAAPRWASLWVFPFVELASGESFSTAAGRALAEWTGLEAPAAKAPAPFARLRHSITRYQIELELHALYPAKGRAAAPPDSRLGWYTPAQLDELAMPSPHRKLARAVQSRESWAKNSGSGRTSNA